MLYESQQGSSLVLLAYKLAYDGCIWFKDITTPEQYCRPSEILHNLQKPTLSSFLCSQGFQQYIDLLVARYAAVNASSPSFLVVVWHVLSTTATYFTSGLGLLGCSLGNVAGIHKDPHWQPTLPHSYFQSFTVSWVSCALRLWRLSCYWTTESRPSWVSQQVLIV